MGSLFLSIVQNPKTKTEDSERRGEKSYNYNKVTFVFHICNIFLTGVYILASQKNSSPHPPLKFFSSFVDFFAVFKLHKGISTCVLSLFFSSFPPFPFLFFKSSFKFFLVFQFGQNIYIPVSLPTKMLPRTPISQLKITVF